MSSFVFTGRCPITPPGWDHVPTRDELHLMCGRNGHSAFQAVTNYTGYLVASRTDTIKAARARVFGAQPITYSDFFRMMDHIGMGPVPADGAVSVGQVLTKASEAAETPINISRQYIIRGTVSSSSQMWQEARFVYLNNHDLFAHDAVPLRPARLSEAQRFDTWEEADRKARIVNGRLISRKNSWVTGVSVMAVEGDFTHLQSGAPEPQPEPFQARRRVLNIAGE